MLMVEETKIEEVKLLEYKVRIRGNKLNRDPFVEVFTIFAKDKREARTQVNAVLSDASPKSVLYKYGRCEERFISEIEPVE